MNTMESALSEAELGVVQRHVLGAVKMVNWAGVHSLVLPYPQGLQSGIPISCC